MADNVPITQGSGTIIAADDIGSVLHQRVKISLGADGEAADLDGGQQSMANSVPVAIASDQAAVPTKDAGPNWSSSKQYTTSANMTTAADLTAVPSSGQKIVVTDVILSTDTAMLFSLKEETSGTVLAAFRLSPDSPIQITPRGKWKLDTADKKLQGLASVAGNVYVTVLYFSEA